MESFRKRFGKLGAFPTIGGFRGHRNVTLPQVTYSANLFENVACPLCGGSDQEVIKPAKYPANISAEELERAFSASSDHQLLDQVVRCRACDMYFLSPRPKSDLIIRGYSDAVDPVFVAQNPQRVEVFTRNLRSALKSIGWDSGAGKSFLDVGCAGGASLVAARTLGFEVTGIEPSRWMAEFGRKTYGVDIRQGTLEADTFAPQSFDLISLWDVLEHIPDPNELLRIVLGLLKPGGVFIVTYPDIGSLAQKILRDRWPFWLSVHLNYYTPKTMRVQLEKSGFQVLEFRSYWMTLPLHYTLERAAAYIPPMGAVAKLVRGVGLGNLSFTYNMGQTLVITRARTS